MQSPLTVLLLRRGAPENSEGFSAAVRTAFGFGDAGVVSDAIPLLAAGEFREFIIGDSLAEIEDTLRRVAQSSRCVLAIMLDASASGQPLSQETLNEVEAALVPILADTSHFAVLSLFLQNSSQLCEDSVARFSQWRVTRFGLADLDERDLRGPLLGLQVLSKALELMTAANGLPPRVRLFFSHAKKDGVPIATAAGDWMRARLHGFQAFYDTVDLDLSGDIDLQLQSAIATAMVIVFRTEIFDQRYWCQKEVLWAEKHGRPMLAVDARWQLQHAASVITFDGAPAVRVPDGSFVRIFSVALHEAVRVEIFKLRVTLRKKVIPPSTAVACIPRCPSMVALGHACESLSQSGSAACCIVYPNPSLPAMMGEVIAYFVDKAVPGCRIMSFDEFTLLA